MNLIKMIKNNNEKKQGKQIDSKRENESIQLNRQKELIAQRKITIEKNILLNKEKAEQAEKYRQKQLIEIRLHNKEEYQKGITKFLNKDILEYIQSTNKVVINLKKQINEIENKNAILFNTIKKINSLKYLY